MEKLDGKSLDLTKENINALKQLFPEVITEGKVDFDKLKLVLGKKLKRIMKDTNSHGTVKHKA